MGENKNVPKSAKCLPPAQHQTGETPLGQANRKLCMFMRTELHCQTKGEKFDVEGRGYADVNVSTLDVEVLITLIKLDRSDQLQFPQLLLSSF